MKSCSWRSPARRLSLSVVLALAAGALLAAASFTTSVQNPSSPVGADDGNAVPGEVLVKFQPHVGRADAARIASEVDADWHREVGGSGVRLLHSRRWQTSDLVERLSRRADVLYAEPNYVVRALATPRDPNFPQLWGLHNVGQAVNGGLPGTPGADVAALSAWDVSTGSRSTVVAVIDTGIDYTHPDLAPNIWSAPAPFTVTIGTTQITCAAGTHGFNAITKACDPMDDHNHGSHVSGTIGAVGDNAVGVVGVNWTASIVGVKFLDSSGSGTMADAVDAIEFLIQAKAAFAATGGANVRVLSNSWGGSDFSQTLLDEIVRAGDNEMLFVAAAGNSGLPNELFPTYPASYDAANIISVAATDNTDRKAYFSNYGPTTVHLGAPGVDVLSTTIGNTYSYFSGTSMATPHVSGAAALVLSVCPLDTADLKNEILNSVDPVPDLSGMTITGGRLNVNSAIRGCSAVPAAPGDLAAVAGDGQVTLTWSPVAGAASYNVKRSGAPGGPYTTIGGSRTATYTDTAVTNDATYYYVVSAVNRMGESLDSAEVGVTPKVPADLVVSTLTVPAGPAGGTIVVTDTTTNQGPGVAGPSTTRFYLSANAWLDTSDTPLAGNRAVPLLAAGASSRGATSVTIPDGVAAGSYYVIARADADGIVVETSETNNTTAQSVQLGPDLAIAGLDLPSSVAPGSVVSVSDTTKNQGAGTAPASVVRFYLSTNVALDAGDTLLDGSRAVPSLPAGATSSGSTGVTVPANLAVGTYYVIAMADADRAVPEANEINNTYVRAVQSGADLVVSALTGPGAAAAGAVIVVTDTTKNQGAGVAGPSTTRFYLSPTISLDSGATLLDGSRSVPSLAAGASSRGPTLLTVPRAVSPGSYYLFARADADAAVPETSDANNTAPCSLLIGADLVVSALQLPPSVAPGATVAIGDTTKNQGADVALASVTRFYLSRDFALDAGDMLLEGSRFVPSLAAGAASSGSTNVTLPASVAAGTYYVIAKADADGTVAETNEGNNTASATVPLGADLVVSALIAPASAASGSAVVVADTTRNQGTGAAGASLTRFYLSANALLDAGDTPLGGSRAVPALEPGASSTGSTSVTIPAGLTPGTYYLIAAADADGGVPETVETNNSASRSLSVGPDLVVGALQLPSNVGPGAIVSITETTMNQGAEGAGPSVTRFYLSTNFVLDAGDTLLEGSRAVPALAPGASSTGSASVVFPAAVPVGICYVIAKSDADGAVAEANETNNTAGAIFQSGPDLVVAGLSGPASAAAGATIVLTDTTRNQGSAVAPASTTRFYLSPYAGLDSTSRLLDGSRAVAALAAGESSTGSASVAIPAGLAAGTYYLFAKADADGAVVETAEANNTNLRILVVSASSPRP